MQQTLEELDQFIAIEEAKVKKCNALIKEFESTPWYRFIKRHKLWNEVRKIIRTYKW